MTRKPKPWSRKQWGVVMTGNGRDQMLLGSLWGQDTQTFTDRYHAGEPTRALLFTTRRA